VFLTVNNAVRRQPIPASRLGTRRHPSAKTCGCIASLEVAKMLLVSAGLAFPGAVDPEQPGFGKVAADELHRERQPG